MIAALTLASSAAAGALATPISPATPKAPSSATASDTLNASTMWWEKMVVTFAASGQTQSCVYQTSLAPKHDQQCDVVGDEQAAAATDDGAKNDASHRTQITFERRFSPDAAPAAPKIAAGDTLIGGQIMALTIDAHGRVAGCKVVKTGGDVTPDYGCAEAKAEKFAASAPAKTEPTRTSYMTILVYGHEENVA